MMCITFTAHNSLLFNC